MGKKGALRWAWPFTEGGSKGTKKKDLAGGKRDAGRGELKKEH